MAGRVSWASPASATRPTSTARPSLPTRRSCRPARSSSPSSAACCAESSAVCDPLSGMDEALLLIQAYQSWIYLILGLALLLYLRSARSWYLAGRRAEFGLGAGSARRGWTRSGVMAMAVVAVGALTFLVATVLSPAVPAALRPTPLPTVSLLATPSTPAPDSAGPAATALPEAALDSSGCVNPGA